MYSIKPLVCSFDLWILCLFLIVLFLWLAISVTWIHIHVGIISLEVPHCWFFRIPTMWFTSVMLKLLVVRRWYRLLTNYYWCTWCSLLQFSFFLSWNSKNHSFNSIMSTLTSLKCQMHHAIDYSYRKVKPCRCSLTHHSLLLSNYNAIMQLSNWGS